MLEPTTATKAPLNHAPVVVASATPDSGSAPLTVAFSGAGTDSGGAIASYLWNFGDGASSRMLSSSHIYRAPGVYTATLSATDDQGITATSSVRIRATVAANQPPMVTIMASPSNGPAPLAVSFMADGTDADGTVQSYEWTFGDGSGSMVQNPTHTFTATGTYMVHVTATDDRGASGTDMASIVVGTAANRPPTATAAATPTSGAIPLAVSFTGAGTDVDGTIASYRWTFGDGGTSALQNPAHTFTSAGSRTVMLMVTDDGGATGSASVVITANAPANVAPTATVTATPTTGVAPLAVTFTGLGRDADGTIASYVWAFGDGGTSALQNPSHSYAAAGTYAARLTVTDNAGATGSASVTITVTGAGNRAPTATAAATPLSGTAPLPVAFTGSGTDADGTIASYAWTFGDGGTSALQSPAHTYAAAGSYVAQLTVRDNLGATGSASVTLSVAAAPPSNRAPVANAGLDQLNKDPATTVMLTGAASSDPDGTIASYAWTQVAGPAVTLTGANTAMPSFVGVAKTTTTYRFRLSVTDNGSPALSAVDTVAIGTRITYANLVGPLLLARGTQANGQLLGCTSSGCHSGANGLSPLSTYAQVFSARTGTRSKISPGGSMLKFLLSGEAPFIIAWIDAGAPEKN